jgi:hypothetical protein
MNDGARTPKIVQERWLGIAGQRMITEKHDRCAARRAKLKVEATNLKS